MSVAYDTANIPNDTRFDDFMKEVRELGRNAGAGKDALPALAVRVAKAAQDGILDDVKNKHGKGIDDAAKVYDEYLTSESKKSVLAHTDAGKAVNASKVRQIIRAGAGDPDFVDVIQRLVKLHKDLVDAEYKVKPTYNAIVDAARAQIADDHKDTALTDDEIKEICVRPEKDAPAVADVVGKIYKDLEKLITGERQDGVKCQDEKIVAAAEQLKDWLNMVVNSAIDADNRRLLAEMQARGMNVTLEQVAAITATMR